MTDHPFLFQYAKPLGISGPLDFLDHPHVGHGIVE
jgi:hypothetical protein